MAQPAEFALVPVVAGNSRLAEVNGQVEAARYLGMTAGPLIGGALAAAGGTEAALLVDAATFACVAIAAVLLHARRRPMAELPGEEGSRARDGIVQLFRDRTLAAGAIPVLAALAGLIAYERAATGVRHDAPRVRGVAGFRTAAGSGRPPTA